MTSTFFIFAILFPVGLAFFLQEKSDDTIYSVLSVAAMLGFILFGLYGCGAMFAGPGVDDIRNDNWSRSFICFGLLLGSEIGRKIRKNKKVGTQ